MVGRGESFEEKVIRILAIEVKGDLQHLLLSSS